jgi:Tol biopolymer transport system component
LRGSSLVIGRSGSHFRFALTLSLIVGLAQPVIGQTVRVSVATGGAQANHSSFESGLSNDGQVVAFRSIATNLVPSDTNDWADIFVYDRSTGTTTRVSVSSTGAEANYPSERPALNDDGSIVAFRALASNLVAGDTNLTDDIFVRDRLSGSTTRVSVSSTGGQANGISTEPVLSDDGRFVAFTSSASNLVAGDTNGRTDIFIHDRLTGQTTRVSVGPAGTESNGPSYAPALSADGRYVGFLSGASNLVPGDTNQFDDVFVHDRVTGQTRRVSVSSSGAQANAGVGFGPIGLNADGRIVVFKSSASNLAPGDTNFGEDIFAHDTATGRTTRVSVTSQGAQANGPSLEPAVSADGNVVAFGSYASNLVPNDTNANYDAFVHDRATGTTTRVNVASNGAQSQGGGSWLSLSSDGRVVTFTTASSDLVPGDTNATFDVFLHVRPPSAIPNAPTNLTAIVSGATVTLTWGPPGSGPAPTSYVLEVGLSSGASHLLTQDVGSGTSLTAPAPNGVYYVRVRGRTAAGTGPPSNEVVVRVGVGCAAPPGVPGVLTAAVAGVTVTLTWGAAGGAPVSYVVEVGSAPGLSNLGTLDTGGLATQLTAPAAAGTYYVRVRARNRCGTGAASNEVIVAVGGACTAPPGPPGSLSATVAGRTVTLRWTAATGQPFSYIVEAGSMPGATDLAIVETGQAQTQLVAAAPPGRYFVRLRARNACGVGAASNEVVVDVR